MTVEMKTLTIGDTTYEVVDEAARGDIDAINDDANGYLSQAQAAANTATARATEASTSATNAAASATTATSKASAASTSATNAASSESAAKTAASTATSKASAAATSATNAKTSETNAASSASTATSKASAANTSATSASNSASAAKTSETNAANSATAAAESAAVAQQAAASVGGGFAVPEYWESHISEKINEIKALQDNGGKDCFSYIVIADMHYPSNLGKNAPVLARRIMDECGIKYALVLGDVRTRGVHATKELCEAEWANIEEMLAPLAGRVLMTQGNHDAGFSNGDYDGDGDNDNYAYEFTPAEMFERVYRRAGMAGDAVYDASGTAFYIDDVSNKVRYILLNTQMNFDGNAGYSSYETVNGMAKYPSMWKFRYTQCQYDFLTNDALATVPSDSWKVVIGSHVPINQSGEMPEYPVMVGVLNAYQNKTAFTGEYAGTASGGSVSVPNFTNLCNTSDANFLDNQYMYNDNMTVTNPSSGDFVSNYIPAVCPSKNADIVRIKGIDKSKNICIYSFDSSFNKLTYTVSSAYSGKDFVFDDDGVLTYKAGYVDNYISSSICNNVAYVRVSGKKLTTAEDIVITVNEEITYTEGEGGVGYDAVSVDCDFSGAKGELICYNAGHVHKDTVDTTCYPSGQLAFPIIMTRCDAKEENDSALNAERVAGTTTEQSFDVFTVNKASGTINATKIGAGSDRTINY